ncbi:MAG: translational GTPase TypA, partial [Chloroflexota bacterium]
LLGGRRGRMIDMRTESGTTYLKYLVPTRGLLGFRSNFMTATSGMGQIHSLFYDFEPIVGSIPGRQFGSLIASDRGVSASYALEALQPRGQFFITAGVEVYEGMVVGEHIRPEDLAINVCKTKQLSAIHTEYFGKEVRIKDPPNMSLDDYMEFIAEDELLEVTPQTLRIRKRILNNERRMKEQKAKEKILAAAE